MLQETGLFLAEPSEEVSDQRNGPRSAPQSASSFRVVGHSGGAVGASSYLLLLPAQRVSVAMATNLEGVSLKDLAVDTALAYAQACQVHPELCDVGQANAAAHSEHCAACRHFTHSELLQC